jgi:hypothetical protein
MEKLKMVEVLLGQKEQLWAEGKQRRNGVPN